MGSCQCTAYAADRIFQLCGVNIRSVCPGSYNGLEWSSTLSGCGYPVYTSVAEAIQNKGTLAGLLACAGPSPSCFGGSCNHIAVCEGYDSSLNQVYISEMMGSSNDCIVYLRVYNTSELSSVRWIDISSLGFSSSGSGRGGYFKDKFGEFHWPVKPEKDARFPTSSEYQEFCDKLNEAQEEAAVENPTKFSAEQDNNVLTAARFNEYLHLMQTSDEGTLKGVDDEVELMDDVKRDDVIYAKHFLQLEDLYNHWMYGNNFLVDDNSVPGQIWNFFMMKGYSPIVTAGLIGYIGWESTFDPTIDEIGNGIGYGLCQWSFSRRNDLINWCNSHGYDYRTVQGQLEYMYYEIEVKDTLFHKYCTNGCYAAVCGGYHEGIGGLAGFKNLKDIYEVVWCFTWWWGRPGAPKIEERYEIAQTYYTKFYINNPGTGGSGNGDGIATGTMGWPFANGGGTITQPFTWNGFGGHLGVDISTTGGYGAGSPVLAVDGGTVVSAGWGVSHGSYGNEVNISHGNGLYTRYAHLYQINVSVGQNVSKGQTIGIEGNTGTSDGTHLHFEVHAGIPNGQRYNPMNYLHRYG